MKAYKGFRSFKRLGSSFGKNPILMQHKYAVDQVNSEFAVFMVCLLHTWRMFADHHNRGT